jgi:TP901 family phage tail tape measure protein
MADGSIVIDTKVDSSGFQKGLSGLGGIASKGLAGVTKAIGAVSAGILAVGTYAVKVGSDFEGSMSQVAATMGITSDEIRNGSQAFELLSSAAKEAGSTTQFSASEAAEALNYLALAGYDAEKSVDALPTVLNLAAAGGLDLAYASDMVTDSMSALGLEMSELNTFTDQLARASQKSNTDVSQLGQAILTVGGTAKALAGGTVELNTALGILADNGVKGAEGGTALRNMILSLSAPTDKAAKAMKSLGLEVFDAEGNMRPLNDVFQDLDKSLEGMTEGQKTQVLNEIFNKVDLKSANALLTNSGERFEELAGYIMDSDGAAAQMAETMNDNLKGRLKELASAAEGLGIQLYESIDNPLKDVAETAIDMVRQLSTAFTEGGMDGLVTALGDVLAQAILKIAEAAPLVVDTAVNLINSFVDGIENNLDSIVDAALNIGESLIVGILKIVPRLLGVAIQIIAKLAEGIAESIPGLADTASQTMSSFTEFVLDNLTMLLDTALVLIQALAEGLIVALPSLIESALDIVLGLVEYILDNIDVVIDCALNIIIALAEGLIKALPKLVEKAPVIIQKLVEGIIRAFPKIVEAAGQLIATLVTSILNLLPKILQSGIEIIGSLVSGLIQSYFMVKKAIDDTINKIASTFKNFNWMQLGKDIISGLINGITSMASNVVGAVKNIADNAISSAKKALGIRSPSRVFRDEVGKMVGEGMAEGIEGTEGLVEDSLNDLSDKMINATKLSSLVDKMSATVDISTSNVPSSAFSGGSSISNSTTETNNNTTNTTLQPIFNIYSQSGNPKEISREIQSTLNNYNRAMGV